MSKTNGLLLRSYSKQACDAEDVAERAIMSVIRAYHHCGNDGSNTFEQIVVLVPCDYDCGDTAWLVRKKLSEEGIADRAIVLTPQGHHSSDVLNAGVELLEGEGIKRVTIISNKTVASLTNQAMNAVSIAFEAGAKVAGVGVDELKDIVCQGCVQNTFATWDIEALQRVGSFDSDKGVEEIAPTVRLLKKYGRCVAILIPAETSALDIRRTDDGLARYREVMSTKIARQKEELMRVGANHDYLWWGIMSDYPKTF